MTIQNIFVICADHDKRDYDLFSDMISELREAGYSVYHRINFRTRTDVVILKDIRDFIKICSHVIIIAGAHNTTVGWVIAETGRIKGSTSCVLCLKRTGEYITRTITALGELGEIELRECGNEQGFVSTALEFIEGTLAPKVQPKTAK